METTHIIKMTNGELLFLDDSFSTLMPWPEEIKFNPADVLRKIGHGLEATAPPLGTPKAEVEITVGEAWMIREVAKSYAAMGTEKVGLNLKAKAFEAIFALESVDGEAPIATMPEYMNEFTEEDLA